MDHQLTQMTWAVLAVSIGVCGVLVLCVQHTSCADRFVFGGLCGFAGAVHLYLVPAHLGEGVVLGLLFLLDGVGLIGAGLWLAARGRARAWLASAAIAAVTAGGYLASRTTGIPGFGREA